MQIGLPGIIGELLTLRRQDEECKQSRCCRMLGMLWHGDVVVALLRRIERHHLGDGGTLVLPDERILSGAVHDDGQELAGGDALRIAAADQA